MNAVIFDLDNTLSAATEVGNGFFDSVFRAMRMANNGCVPSNVIDQACEDIWQTAYDAVARKYELPDNIIQAGWREYAKLEVAKPMHGYEDLHLLRNIAAKRFLVTSGFRRLQQSKIDALGFSSLFDGIYIDATDDPAHPGKASLFEEIMRKNELRAVDVFVVGDNPESEIEAGNSLGLQTVQILRPGVRRGGTAKHYINDLSELISLVNRSTK